MNSSREYLTVAIALLQIGVHIGYMVTKESVSRELGGVN
jgi:hypothetical protein